MGQQRCSCACVTYRIAAGESYRASSPPLFFNTMASNVPAGCVVQLYEDGEGGGDGGDAEGAAARTTSLVCGQ